jgi:hypothetical protein
MTAMARHAATTRRVPLIIAMVAVLVVAVVAIVLLTRHTGPAGTPSADNPVIATSSTTTSIPITTSTTTTLPAPAAGFMAGHTTAVGDSVMLDYQTPLQTDIPGIDVQASVSRQWGAGEALLQQLKSSAQLGAEVIVGLGTNGPISAADFDSMMAILQGASRVVFVNIHVDKPWQDPNNAVLTSGATRYPRVLIADWATLAAQNPHWFGSDGTHLAINGPGAVALASLITSTLSGN